MVLVQSGFWAPFPDSCYCLVILVKCPVCCCYFLLLLYLQAEMQNCKGGTDLSLKAAQFWIVVHSGKCLVYRM